MNIRLFNEGDVAGFVEKATYGHRESEAYLAFAETSTATRLLIDIAELQRMEQRPLEAFLQTKAKLFRSGRRIAIVRHKGAAALTLGPSIAGVSADLRVFDQASDALHWLGAGAFDTSYRALRDAFLRVPCVGDLLLPIDVTVAFDVDAFAAAHARSVRTLQRELRRRATTFQQLKTRALLDRARALLADPVLDAADVARRLGFASAAYFGAWFREHVGDAPGAWRTFDSKSKHV